MSHVPEVLVTALALVLLVSLAGAAVLYLLWYYERQSGDGSQPLPGATAGTLNPLRAAPAFVLEAMAFAVLVTTYPLRLVHDVMPFRAQARGETPILLVHGWGANSACFLVVQAWLKLRGYRNVYALGPYLDARNTKLEFAGTRVPPRIAN